MGIKETRLKEKAIELYASADAKGKKILEEVFGRETFVQLTIMERVTSFEDACNVLNLIISDQFNDSDSVDEIAYKKLKIIIKALNEGWVPDWSNSDEYKYFPYFEYKAGFGFSLTHYDYWYTLAFVGSRLVFKTRELAEYAAKQFQSIYNDYLN